MLNILNKSKESCFIQQYLFTLIYNGCIGRVWHINFIYFVEYDCE
jgi:hypothetical protein